MSHLDLLIVGAGPVGLAAGIAAKREGLKTVILDKGIIVNSIYNFPINMTFFTTANLLEIGGHPFPSTARKPTREMALDYYRLVADREDLDVRTFHKVTSVDGEEGDYTVRGVQTFPSGRDDVPFQFKAKYVLIATGYYDNPNKLDVPGIDLPHVHTYFKEPHPFFKQKVVVIGAGNSGAEASLDLYRFGADVTLVHIGISPKATVKYWIATDLRNRLRAGEIRPVMPAIVQEITREHVIVDFKGERISIPADAVFVFTGFTPDVRFFSNIGLQPDKDLKIKITKYFETERNGLFIIGSAAFGRYTNAVFIENGREHAVDAVGEIGRRIKNADYVPDRSPNTVVIQPKNT